MPKYHYVGKEPQNLAGVGLVKPNDVIEVTDAQADGLDKHAPEQFKRIDDVEPAKAEEPASPAAAPDPAPQPAEPEPAPAKPKGKPAKAD